VGLSSGRSDGGGNGAVEDDLAHEGVERGVDAEELFDEGHEEGSLHVFVGEGLKGVGLFVEVVGELLVVEALSAGTKGEKGEGREKEERTY
jgi:hypothetical protein